MKSMKSKKGKAVSKANELNVREGVFGKQVGSLRSARMKEQRGECDRTNGE